MLGLASTTAQFVWGAFIGYRNDGSAALLLDSFDAGSWVIWADDERLIRRVEATFVVARKHDERLVWESELRT